VTFRTRFPLESFNWLAEMKPESGSTPAFGPYCPGTHCPFRCAITAESGQRIMAARSATLTAVDPETLNILVFIIGTIAFPQNQRRVSISIELSSSASMCALRSLAGFARFFFRKRHFFGNRSTICTRMPQGEAPGGCTAFPKNWAWRFTGCRPNFIILPTPPPNGTTHRLPLGAFQLAVRTGCDARYQPFCML
jgi:hypothetical protein